MSEEPEPKRPDTIVGNAPLIDQMQDELISLITAWADRGVSPSESAQLIAATAHLMLIKMTDCTLGELVKLLVKQWGTHGGKF